MGPSWYPQDAGARAGVGAGAEVEKAGLGLGFVGAGVILGLLAFLALSWVSGGAQSLTFLEIRDRLLEAGDESAISPVGQWYAGWIGLTTFGIVTLVALPAALGVRSRATIVFRTLGGVFGLGAMFVHYVGIWQVFDLDLSQADTAPYLVFVAYGLMVLGAVIGPRRVTVAVAPAWAPTPPPMPSPGPPPLPQPAMPPPMPSPAMPPVATAPLPPAPPPPGPGPGPSHPAWPPPRA